MLPSDPLNLFFLLAPFPYDYKKEDKKTNEIIIRLSHRNLDLALDNVLDQDKK